MTRTLSRYFPADHIRAGQPTYFVEKFLNCVHPERSFDSEFYMDRLLRLNPDKSIDVISMFCESLDWFNWPKEEKKHTIRMNRHIKDGQTLQLAVWSGKPYNSPQIKIWEPVKVGVQNIHIKPYMWRDERKLIIIMDDIPITIPTLKLATNDGLQLDDFYSWFRKAEGIAQIIHFTDLRY